MYNRTPDLEVLIPTFNRVELLRVTLQRLSEQIDRLEQPSRVAVHVADNRSTDATPAVVESWSHIPREWRARYSRRDSNLGLEGNAVRLLVESDARWVMYLGDDDHLPEGYVARVLAIAENPSATFVVPGFTSVFADGSTKPTRGRENDTEVAFHPSVRSCAAVSQFGHQLSGLAFKREDTVETYLGHETHRNIYPFIFFVGFNALRGRGVYAPGHQVLVFQNRQKNWRYDASYLLTEMTANFAALFPKSTTSRARCEISLLFRQAWRPGLMLLDPRRRWNGLRQVWKADNVTTLGKAAVIPAGLWHIARLGVSRALRPLRRQDH